VPGFDVGDVAPHPLVQFARWYEEAAAVPQRDAMCLATVADGAPSARMVLLKGVDDRGLVFYTNHGSAKGRDVAANPAVALVFHWQPLGRQVRIVGWAERVGDADSDAYFATRERGSQLGAWASHQSTVLADRAELEARLAAVTARFADGPVPRPPWWGGYRVVPDAVELWQGRADRLHDRLRYLRGDGGWRVERLAP